MMGQSMHCSFPTPAAAGAGSGDAVGAEGRGGGSAEDSAQDWRKCRAIAQVMAHSPHQASSPEHYYSLVCPQVWGGGRGWSGNGAMRMSCLVCTLHLQGTGAPSSFIRRDPTTGPESNCGNPGCHGFPE